LRKITQAQIFEYVFVMIFLQEKTPDLEFSKQRFAKKL